jgi:hypothetical protein
MTYSIAQGPFAYQRVNGADMYIVDVPSNIRAYNDFFDGHGFDLAPVGDTHERYGDDLYIIIDDDTPMYAGQAYLSREWAEAALKRLIHTGTTRAY